MPISGQIGLGGPFTKAGAPTSGVDAVQTLTITGGPTSGTFTLSFGGQTTAPIAWNALAADVQAALQALSSIGAGNVICSGGPLPATGVVITFAGTLAGKPQTTITTGNNLLSGGTTPTPAVASTTAGVKGNYRGAPKGSLCLDTTNAVMYTNTNTDYTPIWAEYYP